ncbi:hypothetical protein ACLOJK_037969 [Asimina triloba]
MSRLSKLNLRNCLILDRLPHLPSLKEFRISYLESVTLPDGGWERLSLPDGLTQLQSLEDLNISFCHNLESLPEGLGQLKKLKSLTILDLGLTHLPDSLGQLEFQRDARGKEVLTGPRFHTSPSALMANGSNNKEGEGAYHLKYVISSGKMTIIKWPSKIRIEERSSSLTSSIKND